MFKLLLWCFAGILDSTVDAQQPKVFLGLTRHNLKETVCRPSRSYRSAEALGCAPARNMLALKYSFSYTIWSRNSGGRSWFLMRITSHSPRAHWEPTHIDLMRECYLHGLQCLPFSNVNDVSMAMSNPFNAICVLFSFHPMNKCLLCFIFIRLSGFPYLCCWNKNESIIHYGWWCGRWNHS